MTMGNSKHPTNDSKENLCGEARKTSRRQILAHAGAVVIASTTPAMLAFSEKSAVMIHIFAFRWRAAATEEQKNRAIEEISAFQGKIPGLLEVNVGKNVSPRAQGYETGGIMKFKDAAALANYTTHPAHKALLAWLLPLIDPIEVDFSASSRSH